MRAFSTIALVMILIPSISGCQSIQSITGSKTKPTQTKGEYSEDLSVYRPVYEAPEEDTTTLSVMLEEDSVLIGDMEISDTLNIMLDSIATLRLKKNTVEGFSILVHNGTNHEEALKVKGELIKKYPDTYSDLLFQEPFFRVKVGRFYQEINAYTFYNEIKKEFPSAIIVPTSFKIEEEKK